MKTPGMGIAAALLLTAFAPVHADVKVQEQPVGPTIAAPDGWGAVGLHGSHVAIITPKGSRTVVLIDGVEGPKFDRIVLTNHLHTENNGAPGGEDQHILFSPDGSRVAYVAQDGADSVVMADGKEVGRSKYFINLMVFSPGGKHLCYSTQSPDANASFFVDGHAGPSPSGTPIPAFSNDDAHYLYPVVNAATHQMNPFIDGKAAPYAGQNFTFTGDGQHVLGISSDKNGDTLLLDGAPVAKAPGATLELFPAPRGTRYAYVEHQPAGDVVVVDGKKIDGADPKYNKVVFSPDGNHAAVICGHSGTVDGHAWVIVDGKKQQTYSQVQDGYFLPDSSAFVYTAINNYKFFLVVNGNEWDGHVKIEQLTADATHAHIAFVDGTTVIRDNKPVSPRPSGDIITGTLAFSPDGSHLAFVHDSSKKLINLDGADIKGVSYAPAALSLNAHYLLFTPDGKHLVYAATSAAARKTARGIAIDGQFIPATDNVSRLVITPDSRHVFWTANATDQKNSAHKAVFLDGKQVATFDQSLFDDLPGSWDVANDGTLSVVAMSGDSIKRLVITPSADTTIETMMAAAAAIPPSTPAPQPRGTRKTKG